MFFIFGVFNFEMTVSFFPQMLAKSKISFLLFSFCRLFSLCIPTWQKEVERTHWEPFHKGTNSIHKRPTLMT